MSKREFNIEEYRRNRMEELNRRETERPMEPYELFGIECDDGWKELYQPILDYIEEYNKDKEPNERIRVLQIKEKFGGLRIYLNFQTKELGEMIDNAEELSYHTCESCGKHIDKQIVEHHWIYPLCEDCYNSHNKMKEEIMAKYEGSKGKSQQGR